ncbi:hypothetical protein Tco_0438084 [Tanacetum coccineum]
MHSARNASDACFRLEIHIPRMILSSLLNESEILVYPLNLEDLSYGPVRAMIDVLTGRRNDTPDVNYDIFDLEGDIIENLLNLDKTKNLPPYHDNQLSGNPTLISESVAKSSSSSPTLISIEESELIWEEFEAYLASDSFPQVNSNPLSPLPPFHNSLSGSTISSSPSLPISETSDYSLEEFADELALITFPPGNVDLPDDIESDLRELKYLLNHDPIEEMDYILEDSIDKNSPNDNLVDTISKMFIDKHALDYSSPSLWDDYDDNLFDLETVNDDTYDDPFDSKEEKIKESKLLIDELDLPGSSDFLPSPECDLVFYEDFSEVDTLSSTNNEDKFSTPGFSLLKEFILLFYRNYLIGTLKLSKSLKFLKARWRFFLALMERTSVFWMFRASIIIPAYHLRYGGLCQASDLKQARRRIARIFEASRALSFCPSFTSFTSSALFWESDIQILSNNVYL